MTQEESRCPRCSDYDKVKEELENNRETPTKKSRLLKNCDHNEKNWLLLTADGTIIAGTILGKEFVDTVINYING